MRALVRSHIQNVVTREWPSLAEQRATLTMIPASLGEALQLTLGLTPSSDGQRAAQRELVTALQSALDARRQRIILSQSNVNRVKWTALWLQGICTLIAIAIVHSDNRTTAGYRDGALRHRDSGLGAIDRGAQPTVHRGDARGT